MSRRRWVYTQGGVPLPEPIEVTEGFQDTRGLQAPVSDLYMDGVRATDGTDIGSRRKREAYMKANGLADAADYRQHWAKKAQERAAFYRGEDSTDYRPALRAAMERLGRKR